jgi:hypothetical protein
VGTVPVSPAWSVTNDITAASLQSMTDAINWDYTTKPVGFFVQQAAQTGWVTATHTAVTFGASSEVIDRDGQHSTASNTSRVVIGGTLGFYRVSGLYAAAANAAASLLRASIALNGSRISGSMGSMAPSSSGSLLAVPTASVIVRATVSTDYVELYGQMSAGSGTLGTAVSGADFASSLLVEWIGS